MTNPLLQLGTLTGLDALSEDLKRRIASKGLGPPRAFEKWAQQILVDHPEMKALVLPAGTAIEGNFELDFEAFGGERIATIAVLGDFSVKGRLINADNEGGPFLIVCGDLEAGQIEMGGASIIVMGSVKCHGVLFCDDSDGALLAGGDISAAAAIILAEQELQAGGTITGQVISDELDNVRACLVPEVFAEPGDPEDEFADGGLIRARLEDGLPVLKG